ncbi:MAG: sulfate adenylyltransferase subunit CysD [Rhodospirillales bacterium]|nr:sulfate adenylyltransferase subunit CysD [Rhodospirillales bacterium]MDE2577001.1 sulfate adenylyltransferase subunit CysD [Rhodospirillales bacterium]
MPQADRVPLPAHLARLEAESIHILREVAAESRAPVMLYSIGKDSTALLHLAVKAFHPARLPFPVLHIDTGWKFAEMIAFRDAEAARLGLRLIVHHNAAARAQGINPFEHGAYYTHAMKTEALKQALLAGGYDAAFGGARRDEEPARAKERILSFRSANQEWDPRNQRPEFWRLYNGRVNKGESVRVFPLSNWTEQDVWQYILHENLAVVPLYFAADRPTVQRGGTLIVVDDAARMRFLPGEQPVLRRVRFRSLGCWPLTGAVLSQAADLRAVMAETSASRQSERGGRLIDRDPADSMERKKREGYF